MASKVTIGLVVVGGLAVLAAGALLMGGSGGKGGSNMPGYTVNGCTITITNEVGAFSFAKNKGGSTYNWTASDNDAWFQKLSADLGFPKCGNIDLVSLAGFYRLTQAYLVGAVATNKISNTIALTFIDGLRSLLLSRGVDPAAMPQGLPK